MSSLSEGFPGEEMKIGSLGLWFMVVSNCGPVGSEDENMGWWLRTMRHSRDVTPLYGAGGGGGLALEKAFSVNEDVRGLTFVFLYRIQTWALEEARRRLEAEGILKEPESKQ